MMNGGLALAGLVLGITASPHCALMCGAPCAALTRGRRRSTSAFHLARMLGYAIAGGIAAGSVQALARFSELAPALRPIWLLIQLAVFALGIWWLVSGSQPPLLRSDGVVPLRFLREGRSTLRASLAGLAWVALPCAALQGGLLLAALAGHAATGALVMLMFALGSTPALALAPWVWSRWLKWTALRGAAPPKAGDMSAWGLRVAGGGLVLMSGWALTHGLWLRVAAVCGLA